MTSRKKQLRIQKLLKRMSDMSTLAIPPKSAEKSGTFSSYDRASAYNADTDTYSNWGANEDADGFIRKEGEEVVVVELDGPGVIWRIWSAKPEMGAINFYFDGEEQPSYTRPFKKFFEQITDEVSPAGFPNLMPKLSGGYNSFFPIPFKKNVKITFSKNWGEYYHFTYTTFDDEEVPSFEELLSKEGMTELAKLDRDFFARGDRFEKDYACVENVIKSGRTTLLEETGAGAISYLGIDIHHERYTEKELIHLLRSSLINIYWDQQEIPSVSVPLGDFFGSAPGYNLMKTIGVGITEKRLYANWYMPFSSGVRIEIVNEGVLDYPLVMHYNMEPLTVDVASELLRFHAKWHTGDFQSINQDRFMPNGDRWPDWPVLTVEGKGRFCGMHLHVLDKWIEPGESSTWWYGHWDEKTIDWWWGEGDEKFFVDGEKFPSSFGTGSEDYFGYAWAAEPPFALFDSAYAAQSLMPVDGNGHTSILRLQVCDNVPFNTKFEAFMEKYKEEHWGDTNVNIHEVTPYWYQDISHMDTYDSPNLNQRMRTITDEEGEL
ncbi:hypothetical protein RV11_GL000798 [Enterococcus phoeniculicola]|uniref:DUF2961 domain-containing protein n=1 Tax=Enterococcus phoeniculicola ATCC BAA-412 TaxID=1158610 RepID=R3WTY5_9ENTE|nr:glycoside hydrolase family 172 protein [Enterococcus phoeniculicola]EOL45280.1 hypothetical protein UC3_01170 [Enterococcus phoeniculicola ATCC BAA-412]EOT74642.1 hypothetical protein I589_02242 [Enterococcus phoeniculicola ATCC BAA-412]OJG70914.1 hypothetical protein RV11_GL000798 [Enterococcus phoeniculicola]